MNEHNNKKRRIHEKILRSVLVNKRTRVIMAMIFVVVSLVVFVGAWVNIEAGNSGGSGNIEAANIDAAATLKWKNENVRCIPGETETAIITLLSAESNRIFAYKIVLPDDDILIDGKKIGTVEKSGEPGIAYYGIMNPGDEIKIPVSIIFSDESSGNMDSGFYGGNDTQGGVFALSNIKVIYCQATLPAVVDVFKIDATEAAELLGLNQGGGD